MLALVLLLAACKPPIAEDTDTSAPDTDTDVGDTDDTDVPGEVTLRLVPTEAGFVEPLGLYPLTATFTAITSETPAVSVDPAGGVYEVRFTPADADLVDAPWAAGLRVAAYALVVGTPTDGWRGIARMDALYIVGEVPSPYSDIGLHEGWNVLWISGEESPPVVGDPLALPIEPNLVARDAASASGTFADGVVADRVAGLSTEDSSASVGDSAASTSWTIAADGVPAESTFKDLVGVRVAGFLLNAYDDADASGGWSDGDTIVAGAVDPATGETTYIAYGEAPDTLDEAHRLVTLGGFAVGWSVVRSPGEGAWPLSDAESAALEMR